MPDRWWPWAAALVAVTLLAPSRASIPVVAAAVLVAGANLLAARSAARGIRAEVILPRRAYMGQMVEGHVRVWSGSRVPVPWAELDVPCGLGLGRTEPHRETLRLARGGTVEVRVPLRCSLRGEHHVGPARVRLGDVFGLAEVLVSPGSLERILVFPQVVAMQELGLPAEFPFVELPATWALHQDRSSAVGVRDYVAGDPLSAIHWPATARSQRLVVKEHDRGESRDTIVCLDLSTAGYPRGQVQTGGELAITVAASVLQHTIVTQRLAAGLHLAAGTLSSRTEQKQAAGSGADIAIAPRSDLSHLRRMLELLALVRTGGDRSLVQMLSGLGIGFSTGTTLLVVTGRLDGELLAHLLRLRSTGAAVTVALVGPDAESDLSPGQLWMPIYRVADVSEARSLAA